MTSARVNKAIVEVRCTYSSQSEEAVGIFDPLFERKKKNEIS